MEKLGTNSPHESGAEQRKREMFADVRATVVDALRGRFEAYIKRRKIRRNMDDVRLTMDRLRTGADGIQLHYIFSPLHEGGHYATFIATGPHGEEDDIPLFIRNRWKNKADDQKFVSALQSSRDFDEFQARLGTKEALPLGALPSSVQEALKEINFHLGEECEFPTEKVVTSLQRSYPIQWRGFLLAEVRRQIVQLQEYRAEYHEYLIQEGYDLNNPPRFLGDMVFSDNFLTFLQDRERTLSTTS